MHSPTTERTHSSLSNSSGLLGQFLIKDLHGTNRFFNALLQQGSRRLSLRIPVTLWFPFCGGQSCRVKRGWAALSQLLSVGREQLHGFLFPLSKKTPSRAAAALVIEGTLSGAACRCPHYLCSSLAPCLCSLSWLETGEYGEKC